MAHLISDLSAAWTDNSVNEIDVQSSSCFCGSRYSDRQEENTSKQ